MLGYFLAERPDAIAMRLDEETRANPESSVENFSSSRPLSVFLLGDDPAMEADLCEHLWSHPDFDLLATHYDARSAMRQLEALDPAIILVHIGSDDPDRLTFIEACRARFPGSLIFASFSKAGTSWRKAAFAAGVTCELTDIEDATLCHHVMSRTVEHFGTLASDADAAGDLLTDFTDVEDRLADYSAAIVLTRLEIEIGRYLASGKSISDIANHLSLSPKQISMHRARIRQSLCCRTNLELNTVLAKYLSA